MTDLSVKIVNSFDIKAAHFFLKGCSRENLEAFKLYFN